MSRRSDQLRTVAQDFCRIHDEWASDDNRPIPDEIYWDAVDTLCDSFAAGDVPEDCRDLSDAVAEFSEEKERFDDRDDPVNDLMPPNSFFLARQIIADALKAKEPKKRTALETIPALLALPGMTHAQVAKIYQFKDRQGRLMPECVQMEIDKPGSVLKTKGAMDGRDWVDPTLPVEVDGNQVAEHNASMAKVTAKRETVAKKKSAPCPETPETLWRQQVSVGQAAKMLGRPETEVAQLYEQFETEQAQALESGEKVDAQTQHIRELAAAGKKPKEIGEQLGISTQKVNKALRSAPAKS